METKRPGDKQHSGASQLVGTQVMRGASQGPSQEWTIGQWKAWRGWQGEKEGEKRERARPRRPVPFPCRKASRQRPNTGPPVPPRQPIPSLLLSPSRKTISFLLDLLHSEQTLFSESREPLRDSWRSCADTSLFYAFFPRFSMATPSSPPRPPLTSPPAHRGAPGQAG